LGILHGVYSAAR